MIGDFCVQINISEILSISIACENSCCIAAVQAVYPSCDVVLASVQRFFDISAYYRNNYFDIEYKDKRYELLSINEFQLILCDFLDMCLECKLAAQQSLCSLHGGVATNGISTLGFIAKSHTGKSTLLALLEASGFHFLSDDIIITDAKTGKIWPYYRPIKLRTIICDQVNRYILAEGQSPLRSEYQYILPSTMTSSEDSYPITALLYLRRMPSNKLTIVSLSDKEAYINLLKNAKIPDRSSMIRFRGEALALGKKFPSFQITYSEASDAVDTLKNIWNCL